jgi:uncharacterized protein YkvS
MKKSTKDIIGAAMAVLNELKPGLEVALLLNFKDAKLDWKRVVNEKTRKQRR